MESELLPDVPPEALSVLEELLPEPVDAEPAIVVPVDFPLLLSVDLPSFLELEDEPDFAFVEDDLDPEAEALLLLSLDDELEPEVDPEVEPEGELELELESLFAPNPLVLPDDDELGVLDVLPDVFDDSFEF